MTNFERTLWGIAVAASCILNATLTYVALPEHNTPARPLDKTPAEPLRVVAEIDQSDHDELTQIIHKELSRITDTFTQDYNQLRTRMDVICKGYDDNFELFRKRSNEHHEKFQAVAEYMDYAEKRFGNPYARSRNMASQSK